MAEVTYYWDERLGSTWSNPDLAVDGILTNFADTSSDGNKIPLTATTGLGTDLGTITKVEIRAYGYGDGNDRIDIAFTVGMSPEYQLVMPGTAGWSAYADVTSNSNVNGWTWAKVADLFGEMSLALQCEYDKSGKGNTMYCAKVEIRVTYTPSNGAAWKQVQYTSEPPTPNAWNQLKHTSAGGWNQIKYEGE